MKNDYIVRNLYRSFVIVSIMSALTATVGMLVDNVVVGRFLGSDALGAMGVVQPLSLLFSAFGNICSGGGTARASQALGRGDRAQVNRIFTVTVLFAFLSGSVLMIAGLIFTPQIAGILGAQGALIVGIGQAAIPVVGMFYGEEDRTALRDTLKTSLRIGMTLCITGAVLLLLFPSFFVSVFKVTDPDIMRMAGTAIRLFAIGMPIALANTIMMNFYQSTGKTGLATLICVLQSLVFTVTMSFLLVRPLGSTGVWLAFLFGEILTLAVIVIYVSVKNGKFSPNLSAFTLLADDFGGDPKDRLELSIGNSMDEVMQISTGISKIGNRWRIDKKLLNEISLCIEEMAGNVVQHAFKPGEKRWFDVLILDKPESVVIRLRDNGAAFDPSNYLNTPEAAEGMESFGIKMILKIADKFDYSRSMGLNVLMISLSKRNTING